MVGGEHSVKIGASLLLWFGIHSPLKILNERMTQLMSDEGVYIGLIQVKVEGWTGFSEEKPCHSEENPVHPDSCTWIYILFKTGHFVHLSKYFKY